MLAALAPPAWRRDSDSSPPEGSALAQWLCPPTDARAACHVPVKNKAHELQVEGAGEAEEADPAGGVLLALAALAEVAVVPL